MVDDKNLFYLVMEAEGDDMTLQPFDMNAVEGNDQTMPDQSTQQPSPDAPENGSNGDPPPLNEEDIQADALDFSGVDGGDGNQNTNEDNGDTNNENAEDNKDDEKLSEKANSAMNKELYDKFVQRNAEIESILENIQTLSPAIPYHIVKENDKVVTQLKSALDAGKNYVIEKFINLAYGENLLYYKKLDALYILLMDKINENLKKADTE